MKIVRIAEIRVKLKSAEKINFGVKQWEGCELKGEGSECGMTKENGKGVRYWMLY